MKEYKHIELSHIIRFIKGKYYNSKNKIIMTILTWQDGDYFEEICNEDGGIIPEHLDFFKNKPLGKNIYDIDELILYLLEYAKTPYFHSVNGNYKLFYDVYLSFKDYIIIYNYYLKQCYYKEIKTVFDKIKYNFFGMTPDPKWINENQLKLENYNCWLYE